MNPRFPFPRARRGTTLIEVLLGLVILSTLLVSAAMARGRFLRQWKDADQRLAQVKAADDLMEQWMAGPVEAIPLAGRGVVPGDSGMVWRTRTIASADAARVNALVIRLEMFGRADARTPVVSLDFLVRDVRVATTQPMARVGGRS